MKMNCSKKDPAGKSQRAMVEAYKAVGMEQFHEYVVKTECGATASTLHDMIVKTFAERNETPENSTAHWQVWYTLS